MGSCFVIQPFDKGRFDKRYEDVLQPAIRAVGLDPYRVDRDPSVSIPIDDIEAGIRNADACLADITTDNPNVWFELGFAIASQKPVILICSDERQERFPFDVQHRSIIRYPTESARDFEELQQSITKRLKAALDKMESLERVGATSIAEVKGLAQHELAALITIAESGDTPEEVVSAFSIRRDMEKAGFTRIATTLALATLSSKKLAESAEAENYDGEKYAGYRLGRSGLQWLLENQDQFVLHRAKTTHAPISEDDIPF